MRRLLEFLIGTSIMLIGTCMSETALKLPPVSRYGDSIAMLGCTWAPGAIPLPHCPYWH